MLKIESVQNYYGKILTKTSDLKTNACCTADTPPNWLRKLLRKVHPEVLEKYYGCGLVAPQHLQGCTVVDLGCGAGRDVYVLAQMVGEHGKVIGVDMTKEQLEVATKHQEWHAQKAGFAAPNTQFVEGYIEDLSSIASHSVDVVVSNCVINLSPDKAAVFKEVFRILKPGGEMYFSDVYSDRRIPQEAKDNEVLWGECLSGALYWNDFLDLAKAAGFLDPRLVHDRIMDVENEELQKLLGNIQFWSATYRLWKLDGIESICEDYAQVVRYTGGIENSEAAFVLDNHHLFEKGQAVKVCGNSWRMLAQTRFAKFFDFWGDFSTHFGAFVDCGAIVPFSQTKNSATENSGACCS
jgi:arsenite methyltransferase